MKKLLTEKQHQELSFVFMWYSDWKNELHASIDNFASDELVEHLETMKWYAYMAVEGCETLGLNPELLFHDLFIKHACEYKNEILPRQIEESKAQLRAEGII